MNLSYYGKQLDEHHEINSQNSVTVKSSVVILDKLF